MHGDYIGDNMGNKIGDDGNDTSRKISWDFEHRKKIPLKEQSILQQQKRKRQTMFQILEISLADCCSVIIEINNVRQLWHTTQIRLKKGNRIAIVQVTLPFYVTYQSIELNSNGTAPWSFIFMLNPEG